MVFYCKQYELRKYDMINAIFFWFFLTGRSNTEAV